MQNGFFRALVKNPTPANPRSHNIKIEMDLYARGRRFTFTLNNYTEDQIKYLEGWQSSENRVQCIYFGREVAPTTQTPHLQGFICFKSPSQLRAVINGFSKHGCPGTHVELMKASIDKNKEYCSKEGQTYLFGSVPSSHTGKTAASEYAHAIELATQDDFFQLYELYPELSVKHYASLHGIAKRAKEIAPKPGDRALLKNYWLFSKSSGVGKSKIVRDIFGDNVCIWNHQYPEYENEHAVLFDDIVPSDLQYRGGIMKRLCDHYPVQIRSIYGKPKLIRPQVVIFTSNYRLQECFEFNEIPYMERRTTQFDCDEAGWQQRFRDKLSLDDALPNVSHSQEGEVDDSEGIQVIPETPIEEFSESQILEAFEIGDETEVRQAP